MNPEQEIQQELEELNSPLAALPRTMPYAVPEGYFAGLNGAVRENILRADKTASVPAGYFQNLPQSMLAAAKAANAAKLAVKPKTRIIALPPARRWAAAAVLLVAFAVGGTLLFNGKNSLAENSVASLPRDAVQEYVAANVDELDLSTGDDALLTASNTDAPQLSGLSEAELEAYLTDEGVLF